MPSAITIKQVPGKPGQVYYPLEKITLPEPKPSENQVVVSISAAALNHRDLFIRQHLYPGTTFGVPLLADGVGVVTSAGSSPSAQQWLNKRVILNPGTGWKDSLDGPEHPKGYAILGGTKTNPAGTLAEKVLIEASELEEAPKGLSDAEAAALPLTGLTAWRAFFVKTGNAKPGYNILITGIGGGVALMTLLFAVAQGCNVYVTSGSEEKIQKAKALGAAGGVNYKEQGWEKKLQGLLPQNRKYLDAIVDGAGGDVVSKGMKLLKAGGVISVYGMTISPKMDFLMGAVLRNIEVKGSTMGSRKEFAEMVDFVNKKNLKPVVSRVVNGLDLAAIDTLFDDMKNASQFGKLVVQIDNGSSSSKL
ncbi:NAD(P)-binding protein [Aaosphaeria arxii CBS 175.79]|uniref:NAD(P)-binding protein n=1 Tax=Aaosphaeria arxii CBS 175.79 TaxID=1450172 RepID=A0A6A5XC05_9PLEO|nr:NAD(P)-binding protein [Aaosphaeria arxii CBS 175.79]KAF2010439.1 NAD(P)-binding protein [Aaosphaeria arxii CBS 175.79]